jgi:5'-phosphate synthase pdxT subunit
MTLTNQPRIGILALQGDYESHRATVEDVGGTAVLVKTPEAVAEIDALILPGGESTVIGKLMARYGIDTAISEASASGMPIYGTCAGMILLAKRIDSGAMRGGQPTLGLMDIAVARNAFGRQVDSFETEIETTPEVLGDQDARTLRGVFIRAPYITEAGPKVDILARHQGLIVLARQGNLLASAFHPELTGDSQVHRYFLQQIVSKR